MGAGLHTIFEAIHRPSADNPDKPVYAVLPVPGHESYFVGKDNDKRACLLVATGDKTGPLSPPIRLGSLDVQFELRCCVKKEGEPEQEGVFTVIQCRALDEETIRYFLSVSETIMHMIGDRPTRPQVAAAVNRLAAIFQRMQKPPTRPVTGLFGELYLIWRSGNAARTIAAWRADDTARFDFYVGDIRLDVKATAGRQRIHAFSYDQCNPPAGTIAIVASVQAEQIPNGVTLESLIHEIEARIATHLDLVLKLHETIAATLGTSFHEAVALRFDVRLADSSLAFFNLEEIPAIRGVLPSGVSDVHFRSDLSPLSPLSIRTLIDQDPAFWDLLPRHQLA